MTAAEQSQDKPRPAKNYGSEHTILEDKRRHRDSQSFWLKLLAVLPWTKRKSEFNRLPKASDLPHPLSNSDLLSIYTKLNKCCDADESELKEAIGYGRHIITEQKLEKKDQKRALNSDIGETSPNHNTKRTEPLFNESPPQTPHNI